jgi:hypothetical protein
VIEVEKADISMPKEGNPEARKAKQCPLEINRFSFWMPTRQAFREKGKKNLCPLQKSCCSVTRPIMKGKQRTARGHVSFAVSPSAKNGNFGLA